MLTLFKRITLVAAALATIASVAAAQGTTISGRVTSEQGAPIPGVSVFIPTLNIGGQTNDAGNYTFVVSSANAHGQSVTLTARVIGYSARSVPVTLTAGGTVTENFVLALNPLRLGEVVVTGAGTSTTREKLTTTINTVDSTALRRATQPQNIVSALAAQAPNVEVRTQSGEPGSSASIKIRGASSLSGTGQPLFVVDGQPIDNSTTSTDINTGQDGGTVATNRASDINPADIESIQILKSSAAAAIYGAAASNGVVLITTKRGHSGATRYTLSSTNTFDRPYLRNELLQRQYGQGADGVAAGCVGTDTPNCSANRYSYGPLIAAGTPVYNHESELFDTGITSANNLQVSGGNERTTFFASGGLTSQNGYFKGPNNVYNRANIRLKGTQQVSSKFSVGGNISYNDDRGRYVQKGSNVSGVMLGALRTAPTFNDEDYLNANGFQRAYRFPNATSADAFVGRGYYDNPFFVLNNPGNKSELGRSIGNVNADWNPLGWLAVKYTLGADYYSEWKLEALPLTSAGNPSGAVLRLDNNNLVIDHNLIATAQHTFSENFDATVSLGQNLNSRRYRQAFIQGQPLVAPNPLAIQNTISKDAQEFRSLRHIESYFGQVESTIYGQLTINAGVRNDGFSTFGASNQRHNFPKASLAWTFTNASEIKDRAGPLSYGKLHYAYGETGKEPPIYAAVTTLTNGQFLTGFGDVINSTIGGVGGIITATQLGNPNLQPERNRESEYGLDLAFFNNRVDFTGTYYNKHSDDVIIAVPVNTGSTGALTAVKNAASLTNKGVEITLNARPVTTANFAWDVGVQFGKNKGNVTSLAGTDHISYNNEGFTGAIGSSTLGFAPGVIRGFDFVRCGHGIQTDINGDNVPDDVDAACGPTAKKGALYLALDTTFNDDGSVAKIQGLPVDNPQEQVIADPNPKYSMSYTTSVKLWNKITLSGLLDVRKGGSVWNGTRGILNVFGTGISTLNRTTTGEFGKNFLTTVYPAVAGPGAGTAAFTTPQDWQDWYQGEGGGFGSVGEQFVEDGSFVKLRELGITYTADQSWVRSLTGFTSADIRIAGRNLKTWSKYSGFDPEVNLGGSEFITQGLDYFINPPSRSFVLSVSLNR
jgi:TonB-linked SusC/RagA family outer membrane protein